MLDGILLSLLREEIKEKAIGARVEKIHQVSKDELVFSLKGRGFSGKLLMSAKGNSPRVHFTEYPPENPLNPPMFCMLLRKYLIGGFLSDIRQEGLERVLFFEFECTNEMGDKSTYTLATEIMSRHSNIIFINDKLKVVDSIKRVDTDLSSARLILPGLPYEFPPKQDKLDLLPENTERISKKIKNSTDRPLSKAIMAVSAGLSPIISREISYLATGNKDSLISEIENFESVSSAIDKIHSNERMPILIVDQNKKAIDFTFTDINQYGNLVTKQKFESYSGLLDAFYRHKAEQERTTQRSSEILKTVTSQLQRVTRKIEYQKEELRACRDRDKLRIFGELVNANLYKINKGDRLLECENYYENNAKIKIPLDRTKSPAQNAQRYYKEYKKAVTAEKILTEQIKKGTEDKEYLESVLDLLKRSRLTDELNAIKSELAGYGYIRNISGRKKQKFVTLPPKTFISSDGFRILVGRNNLQNDELTFKKAEKSDLWFHTKDIHGSHTVLKRDGRDIAESAIIEAAMLAAFHSKAADSQNVPVDYTEIKFVKKPSGAKAGKVIYTNQKTVYVTPNRADVEKMSKSS